MVTRKILRKEKSEKQKKGEIIAQFVSSYEKNTKLTTTIFLSYAKKDVDKNLNVHTRLLKKESIRTVLLMQAGLSSLDSQTAMARIGCVTMVGGGMTNTLPLEQRTTHQLTLI